MLALRVVLSILNDSKANNKIFVRTVLFVAKQISLYPRVIICQIKIKVGQKFRRHVTVAILIGEASKVGTYT